uniref:Translin-associated factor X-interacting protein 1 isoform X1 n=1 Tax=Petromyzon marinus TaxID=7757 RepID=A0AAJ7XGE0_PETMA|nr:translin-associated factor X-interacting protein 1 isoform X1 [Petromyzon marinus]
MQTGAMPGGRGTSIPSGMKPLNCYQLSGAVPHQLPPKDFIEPPVGSAQLSVWPAGPLAVSPQAPGPSECSRGLRRPHGTPYPPASHPSAKPRFLQQLEADLRQELGTLKSLNPDSQDLDLAAQELRLQAFREAFNCIIENFTTYKPLLAAIKCEYEATLGHLRRRVAQLEPLRGLLVAESERRAAEGVDARREEGDAAARLRRDNRELSRRLHEESGRTDAAQLQVERLKEELSAEYRRRRDESDARRLLNNEILELRALQENAQRLQAHEDDWADPVGLRLALHVARQDLSRVQDELTCARADYADVVPRRDHEALAASHAALARHAELRDRDLLLLQQEHGSLLELHEQLLQQRDGLSAEVEALRWNSTPRPPWEECGAVIEGGVDRWTHLCEGRSSGEIMKLLLAEVTGVSNPGFTEDNADQEVGGGADGAWSVEDLCAVVRDVWREKRADDGAAGVRSELSHFLVNFGETRAAAGGEGSSARGRGAEWARGVRAACRAHRDRAGAIRLFLSILDGELDESLYHGQIQILSQLERTLSVVDSSATGILSAQQFTDALHRAFPLKEEGLIAELHQGACAQLGLDSIDASIPYRALFTEGESPSSQEFMQTLHRQTHEEKLLYLQEVEEAVGDTEEVSVSSLRAAFLRVDPCLDQPDIDAYLARAFHSDPDRLERAPPCDWATVAGRLKAAHVRRAGPPPS